MGINKVKSLKLKVKSLGFTLIETIVVLAVIGLVLPALFAIIFVLLQQQTKVFRLQQVKKEGDFVLNSMKTTIINRAQAIFSDQALNNEQCKQAGTTYSSDTNFYFKDKQGVGFKYYINGSKISSDSASIDPIDLTTDKVTISDFTISCNRTSAYSPPVISLTFTVSYNTASTRVEENASLTYSTKINLKTY